MSDRDNPAPTLDSQNAKTKLDTAVPTPGDAEATLGSAPAVEVTAKRDLASIGPYRLVKKLGEGGMGQVWLAEQTAPLQRQVALKLIKVGIYDDSVLQRFQSERQSLAIMEHPSIAKVFDAGATVDGQPYFVMEYVPGVPITDYCDQKRLKIRDRLELFIKVCAGVQHAHQKAIIHRDLKPANILVAEVDGKPIPRIIDFGLAKIDHAVIEVHRASSGPPRLPLRLIRRAVPIVVDGLDRTLEGITIATHEQVKEYNRDVATLETIP